MGNKMGNKIKKVGYLSGILFLLNFKNCDRFDLISFEKQNEIFIFNFSRVFYLLFILNEISTNIRRK